MKNDAELSLGSFIKQRRAESGLTLNEVSRYLEISVETLVRYEEDKKQIPLHHIYALSNCLNIPADVILKWLSAPPISAKKSRSSENSS